MFARKSKVSPHAAEDSDQTDHTDTTPVAAPEQSATLDQHSNTRPAQGMPLQSSQSQSDFHWIITSTLFSSWWPWTFLGDREMTRARRLSERSRVQRDTDVLIMSMFCASFLASAVQFLVAYALLSEETGMGGTESWHAFVAGANNKTYNFFRF